MGLPDILRGAAIPCPCCGEQYWLEEPIDLFDHWRESDVISPGESFVRREYEASEFDADRVGAHWLRLRPSTRPGAVSLLLARWERCSCGAHLGPLAHLTISPAGTDAISVRLDVFELVDMRLFGSLCRVDFFETHDGSGLADLTELPHRARREQLASFITRLLQSIDAGGDMQEGPGCLIRGPVRCEACGHVRTLRDAVKLHHPGALLGEVPFDVKLHDPDTWLGDVPLDGVIAPGMRFTAAPLARSTDRHCSRFTRLREPVSGVLTLLASGGGRGCRCGAGRAATLARFVREGDDLVLDELSWRVVSRVEDLSDVDWLQRTVGVAAVHAGQGDETRQMRREELSDVDGQPHPGGAQFVHTSLREEAERLRRFLSVHGAFRDD